VDFEFSWLHRDSEGDPRAEHNGLPIHA